MLRANRSSMKRKVAIPLFGTRISPHFTYADMALLVDIENGEVAQSHEIALGQADELQRIQYLKSLDIDTLICGGISNIAERMLAEQAVNVISWVTGEAQDALEQFLCKQLAPGTWLCPKRHRCRRGPGKSKKTVTYS
jgi:predicted Fe-Mo cluster-binding NifX family protein